MRHRVGAQGRNLIMSLLKIIPCARFNRNYSMDVIRHDNKDRKVGLWKSYL